MTFIDIRTVIISYAISNSICTIVMTFLWIRNRRHFAGIGFWLTDFIFQSIAIVLAASRGILPAFTAIVLPNVLLLTGAILMLIGLERFTRKHTSQTHNYLLLAVFVCVYTWLTLVQPSVLGRTISFSLALIFVVAQNAWLMLVKVTSDLRSTTRGVGTIFLSACLVTSARIVVSLIIPPSNDFFSFDIYDTLYILANQMIFIGLTFGLVLMINRRLITGMEYDISQRERAESALRESHQIFTSALQYRTNVLEALNQVTLDLVNRHEMDDILQTLLVKIGTLLDASDISFDMLENDDALVTYAVTSEQPLQKGDIMRRGEGGWLSWQAIDSGQPAILEDYSTWSKRRILFDDYPIHAIMIVPVHQRERVVGAINIARKEAGRPFNDTDTYAAKQLAQMVALVLDNAQLYAQLQAKLAESVQREENLHQAQTQVIEQQRRLAIFDERQRMARDLHDSVNQSLHSLVLFSETLDSVLEKNNISRARQIAGRLQDSAQQALKETRLLLYQNQVSADGRALNLIEELNARLIAIEHRAGVKAQVTLEGSLDDCPKQWHENLFWIAIEALNNSLKHAQAQSVQIIIRCLPTAVELEVVDDGKGFDTAKPQPGGYGLHNMQERANALNGNLTVISTPAAGTSIRFRAEHLERAEPTEPAWTK